MTQTKSSELMPLLYLKMCQMKASVQSVFCQCYLQTQSCSGSAGIGDYPSIMPTTSYVYAFLTLQLSMPHYSQ